ncbi:hypothetical protein RRF57_013116 [Xylaria bambusicola]|uniref:Uncharacterized protein n=1 Tax=Xylaria bambusicola TaxID=326684 RepID=A0AAN7UR70_9PEZI
MRVLFETLLQYKTYALLPSDGKSSSTIDDEAAAGHIARSRAAQKDRGVGHFLGGSNATQGYKRLDVCVYIYTAISSSLHHGGVGPRGAETINSDAVGCIIKSYNSRNDAKSMQDRVNQGLGSPAFLVRPSTACLAVVYCTIEGVATKEDPDPKITIDPRQEPRPESLDPISLGS